MKRYDMKNLNEENEIGALAGENRNHRQSEMDNWDTF